MNVRTKWGGRRMLHVDGYADGALSGFKRGQHGIARRMFQKPNKPGRAQYLRHSVVRKVDKVRLPHAESLFPNGSNSYDFFHIRLFSYHKSTEKLRTHGKQNDADNKSIQQVTSKFTKQNRSARIRRLALQGFKFGNVLQIPMTERPSNICSGWPWFFSRPSAVRFFIYHRLLL